MPIGINKASRNSQISSGLSDTSMFNAASRQWFAGDTTAADGETILTWSDELSETDVTGVNSPTQTTVGSEAAVEYNSTDSDRHEKTAGGVFEDDDEFTIAVVCYFESNSGRQTVATRKDGSGDFSIANDNGTPTVFAESISNAVGSSTIATGELVTLTARTDGSSQQIFYNGSEDGSSNEANAFSSSDAISFAYRGLTGNYGDVHIREVVVSDVAETDSSISSFSSDRLG